MRRLLCGIPVVLLVAACGQSVVVDAAPASPPYEGPLYVEVTAAPDDEKADRTGAAGLVVDCDSSPVGYTEPDPYENSVSRNPTAALERELKTPNRGADSGLREARRENDRVLYVYEVDRQVKQAMIVHRGTALDGKTGWYVESWARCDWAELPAALADGLGLQVWTDDSGRRVPTTRIASASGPEHCSWEDMTFLSIDDGDLDGARPTSSTPSRACTRTTSRSLTGPPLNCRRTPRTLAISTTAGTCGLHLTRAGLSSARWTRWLCGRAPSNPWAAPEGPPKSATTANCYGRPSTG